MKKAVLVVAVLTFALSGCGGDSATSPGPGEEMLLAADTIGTGGGTASGSLNITIDPGTRDVLSFRAAQTLMSSNGFTFIDSIVGSHLTFDHQTTIPNPARLCRIIGTGACASVSVYAYRRDHGGTGTWIELDNFNCQATTYLNASFWYEEGD